MPQHNATITLLKEESIKQALEAIDQGHFKSIRRAAEHFRVPRSTLQTRINGTAARQDCIPHNRALTPIEEEVLLEKVLDLDSRGFSPNHATIPEMASSILKARTGKGVGLR